MLEIKNLCVTGKYDVPLLTDISFTLSKNDCLGITGPSGSGKTTLIKCIMGILDNTCKITSGKILLNGKNIIEYPDREYRQLCGIVLGFIPQNPMTAFFNNCKIGQQIIETFIYRLGLCKVEAVGLAKDVLHKANLQDVNRILNSYSNQLSGGMLQRVAIAILIGLKPHYILADEPISALDEENKYYVLDLLRNCQDTGILLISHNINALMNVTSQTMVIEQGKIIEKNYTKDLILFPECKWTKKFSDTAQYTEEGDWDWKKLG